MTISIKQTLLHKLAELDDDQRNSVLDELDMMVFDEKEREACEINNGGSEDQIEYLLERLGLKKGKEVIKNLIESV